jgi:hypothetical protein
MIDLEFNDLSLTETKNLLDEIAPDIAPVKLTAARTAVRVANLSFYDEFRLYALSDLSLPAPNTRYMLYKPGDVSLMNWTNEPIYEVNERAPIRLDRTTAISYAKFFFHYVRGQLGRFIIVEKPDEVVWLAGTGPAEKAEVAARLMPVIYKGDRKRQSSHPHRNRGVQECLVQNRHPDRALRHGGVRRGGLPAGALHPRPDEAEQ